MVNIDPIVRHMILADNVSTDSRTPPKIGVHGLIQIVHLTEPVRYPATISTLCVLLVLAGGRGKGIGQIIAVDSESDQPLFGSLSHEITYSPDPLEPVTVVFRINECKIPEQGMYWIQFWHNGNRLAEQPFIVRER